MNTIFRTLLAGSATALALVTVGPVLAQDSMSQGSTPTSPTVTADLQQEVTPPADLSGLTPGPDIEGIITARTCSDPSAPTAIANTKAESTPPQSPRITPGQRFLCI